jgi:hypothetical protein
MLSTGEYSSTSESDYRQLVDFPATAQVKATDLIYSATGNIPSIEQKSTVAQLQSFVLAPIANSTLPSVSTLTGAETVPLGVGGLFQTTIAKIANWIINTFWSTGTYTVTPGMVQANSTLDVIVAVPNAILGQQVLATPNVALESGIVWNAFVSSNGNISVRFANVTTASIAVSSASWNIGVIGN